MKKPLGERRREHVEVVADRLLVACLKLVPGPSLTRRTMLVGSTPGLAGWPVQRVVLRPRPNRSPSTLTAAVNAASSLGSLTVTGALHVPVRPPCVDVEMKSASWFGSAVFARESCHTT